MLGVGQCALSPFLRLLFSRGFCGVRLCCEGDFYGQEEERENPALAFCP